MKYSVQQIEQSLKEGKTIFFKVPYGEVIKYEANLCPNPDLVVVSWMNKFGSYNDVVYKLMTFIGSFDNGWICTKIEGEETMEKKTPHKHAEFLKLFADGVAVQKSNNEVYWSDVTSSDGWYYDYYRVKPTLVKKWKWVFKDSFGDLKVTDNAYSEQEFNKQYQRLTLIQKIDSTMIEVEE